MAHKFRRRGCIVAQKTDDEKEFIKTLGGVQKSLAGNSDRPALNSLALLRNYRKNLRTRVWDDPSRIDVDELERYVDEKIAEQVLKLRSR